MALIEQRRRVKKTASNVIIAGLFQKVSLKKSSLVFKEENWQEFCWASMPLVNYHADITNLLTGYEKNWEHMARVYPLVPGEIGNNGLCVF